MPSFAPVESPAKSPVAREPSTAATSWRFDLPRHYTTLVTRAGCAGLPRQRRVYNIRMGTTRSPWRTRLIAGAGGAASLAAGGALVARAGLTLDIGLGRRVRPLGPIRLHISAPPEVVFDVIAAPYLGKTPRALRGKLEVLERGSDLVLAAHFTPLGRGLTVTTVETVRFERPHRISFRLVKGPVPYVVERYELQPRAGATDFAYTGELGTDLWRLGTWWGDRVAPSWEQTVATSLEGVRTEAERRAGHGIRGV